MADKKFSDFARKLFFGENDIIAGETVGVENVAVSYGDLKRQIQDDILTQYGRQSAGRFVDACCEHSGGIPLGYEANLIYADGSQWNRAISQEIAKFIDFCKIRPTLKALYQIPESGDYFIVPDLRNKHRVGVGDVNTPYANITSKVLNPQATVTTTVAGGGDHTHPINNIRGEFYVSQKEDAGKQVITEAFNAFSSTINSGAEANKIEYSISVRKRTQLISFSSHRAGVTATNNGGNHTHNATNAITYTDPNIFDTVNRVPAFAVFTFLDIAINDIYINPNTNIANVQGLQDALDSKAELDDFNAYVLSNDTAVASKVSQSVYDAYVLSNNTAVASKVSQSVYDAYVLSNNTAVASKVSQSTYNAYVTSNNAAVSNKLDTSTYNTGIATKLDITTFNSVFNGSWNSVRRTGLTQVIAGSPTVGRNIITDLQNVATTNTGAVDYLNGTTLTTGYPTVNNAVLPSNYNLPIITGKTSYRVVISIRATGVFATVGDFKDLFARLILSNGTTTISSTNLRRSITDNGSPVIGVFEPIRVTSNADALVTTGFNIVLFNNNNPNSNYTLNTIELAFTYL